MAVRDAICGTAVACRRCARTCLARGQRGSCRQDEAGRAEAAAHREPKSEGRIQL